MRLSFDGAILKVNVLEGVANDIKEQAYLAKLGAYECSNRLSAVIHFTEKTPSELIAEETELNFRLRTALISGKFPFQNEILT